MRCCRPSVLTADGKCGEKRAKEERDADTEQDRVFVVRRALALLTLKAHPAPTLGEFGNTKASRKCACVRSACLTNARPLNAMASSAERTSAKKRTAAGNRSEREDPHQQHRNHDGNEVLLHHRQLGWWPGLSCTALLRSPRSDSVCATAAVTAAARACLLFCFDLGVDKHMGLDS